jgi:hypothetical protein
MNHATAAFLSVADIKAYGPAKGSAELEMLIRRLADLAKDAGNMLLWGWLCLVSEMPDDIAELSEIPRLQVARDDMAQRYGENTADVLILDAAIAVLGRP